MKSSRRKPWKIVTTKNGRKVKYDFTDVKWGIKRTYRTFNSVDEAQAFHEALLKNAKNMAKGEKIERLFGTAMIEYIQQITVENKLSLETDKVDLMTVRWPFNYNGAWYCMEDLPMNDKEGGIVWGAKKYLLDLSAVVKRSYINKSLYHLRREASGLVWYEQPSPNDGEKPKPRVRIKCPHLLKKLNDSKGRGAFSKDTLRRRMSLIKTILNCAWHDWRWLDIQLGALIKLEKPGKGRVSFLTGDQYTALISNVDEYFSYLIQGAKTIGWRESNLIGLTWDRVVFPQCLTDESGNLITVPGYIYINEYDANNKDLDPADIRQRRTRTKNKDRLETVMSPEIETLLRKMWQKKHYRSDVVFHDGNGHYWGDFRKRWKTAKKKANIPEDFRWHDLRHTWATDRINEGVPTHIIMAEQGWKDPDMLKRYAHLQREARYKALKNAGKA